MADTLEIPQVKTSSFENASKRLSSIIGGRKTGQQDNVQKSPEGVTSNPQNVTQNTVQPLPKENKQPEPSIQQNTIPSLPDIKSLTKGKFDKIEDLLADYDKVSSNTNPLHDDFIKGAVDYYNKTGNLSPYLEASSFDPTQMSDDAVIKKELRSKYPNLSEKSFERLYEKEMAQYDSEDLEDDEKELNLELKKIKADEIRDNMKKEREKFINPNNPDQLQKYIDDIKNNEITKSFLDNKRVIVKHNSGDFNYEVSDPSSVFEMMTDNGKLFDAFKGENGKLDIGKSLHLLSFLKSPDNFEKSLIDYGISIGLKNQDKELRNPSMPETPKGSPLQPTDERSKLKMALKGGLVNMR